MSQLIIHSSISLENILINEKFIDSSWLKKYTHTQEKLEVQRICQANDDLLFFPWRKTTIKWNNLSIIDVDWLFLLLCISFILSRLFYLSIAIISECLLSDSRSWSSYIEHICRRSKETIRSVVVCMCVKISLPTTTTNREYIKETTTQHTNSWNSLSVIDMYI